MNKWRVQDDHFTDGDQDVGIDQVRDMILSDVPLQVHADRLEISTRHFVELAMMLCRLLEISVPRVKYWLKISNLQRKRGPQ